MDLLRSLLISFLMSAKSLAGEEGAPLRTLFFGVPAFDFLTLLEGLGVLLVFRLLL